VADATGKIWTAAHRCCHTQRALRRQGRIATTPFGENPGRFGEIQIMTLVEANPLK
jgi:hypothetical protein